MEKIKDFNPRSHERSDSSSSSAFFIALDFNPRSHERSDDCSKCPKQKECISIHAPTRGATLLPCVILKAKFISIHAPTRGATVIISGSPCGRLFQSTLPREERLRSHTSEGANGQYFNPRSHERSDLKPCINQHVRRFQSTLPREERLTT